MNNMLRMVRTTIITKKRGSKNNILDKRMSNTRRRMSRNHMLFFTVAAAFSTTSTNPVVSAFTTTTPLGTSTTTGGSNYRRQGGGTITTAPNYYLSSSSNLPPQKTPQTIQTRLYSTKSNKDGILKRAAKMVLPKKWFQSEEEQKAELARRQVKDQVKGGIKEMLKDAPLPVRMMGSMISPLLSRVASNLSESLAEQQQAIDSVINDSRAYMLGDDVVVQELGGEPIRIGKPFSQSSSTTIINGQKRANIVLGFPVEGRTASGMAQVQATSGGNEQGKITINRLVLQINSGRQINVSLTKRGSSSRIGKNHKMGGGGNSGSSYTNNNDDDNIIEAEIIEKKKD